MPVARVNGVGLYYELSGAGDPLVLVHGSWVDLHTWDAVVGPLAERFRVVTYDRRGHSRSERPAGQGSVFQDADDLAALIEELDLPPAHVAGNSFGAVIALRAAAVHRQAFRSLICHEPPLFSLLDRTEMVVEVQRRVGAVARLLERGDHEGGARAFAETIALGPGAWDSRLTGELREIYVANARTFLDECHDPDAATLDLDALASFDKPTLLSSRVETTAFFGPVGDLIASRIPRAERIAIPGADHVPHISMPGRYVELVETFASTVAGVAAVSSV